MSGGGGGGGGHMNCIAIAISGRMISVVVVVSVLVVDVGLRLSKRVDECVEEKGDRGELTAEAERDAGVEPVLEKGVSELVGQADHEPVAARRLPAHLQRRHGHAALAQHGRVGARDTRRRIVHQQLVDGVDEQPEGEHAGAKRREHDRMWHVLHAVSQSVSQYVPNPSFPLILLFV